MTTSAGTGLAGINHIVVLMLENRSFDHMLGYLYADAGNVSPSGQPFEGLTGSESNPDANGDPVSVYQITPSTPNAYFMPGADPGEGYKATNDQLWGSDTAPAAGTQADMRGFVKDFAYTIGWETSEKWSIVPGTTADWIMGCFTPETLPVLSALAKGYAVCDHWFASAPTETLPNRAFALAGTSQGHIDDHTKTYTCPSIFGALTKAGVSWRVFGYTSQPLTKADFPDITSADSSHFGLFTDFRAAAAAGTLPAFTFSSRAGPPRATASIPTTTSPSASGSSATPTRRCGPVPAGSRRCSCSPTTSTAGATTTCRRHGARLRRTTRRASSASASTASACGSRRCSSPR